MHNIDIDIVDMALDVVKFAISRITETDPKLGFPKKEAELQELKANPERPANDPIRIRSSGVTTIPANA